MSSHPHDLPDFAWLGVPVDTRSLFAPEHATLIGMLRDLAPRDWDRVAVPGWTVGDLVAHLLGDCVGRLARDRDGHRGGPEFVSGETLERFIHRINEEWVRAHRRVSPAVLTDMLDLIGAQTARFYEATDPAALSLGVSWAGADPAPRWLDTARDLTEFWTHRQQIRHAVGLATDPDPRTLSVVLDTFMRALPHTLRDSDASPGTQVQVSITGPAGGTWTVTSTDAGWSLAPVSDASPDARVRLDSETAWRLCTRSINPADAFAAARIEGDRVLAEATCRIVSIIH
ncbi:maleylpyruvate isomerase family mycothiol-dependent enzyme [Streptomyces sp. NPDC048606]|uniref:maleylpyruvate isomerase family mycothiol-dependent enzyme n=1 Tax=Streptomyces sp. NPDC048606 TaxID=3154726 RepID=UPI0034378A98